MVLKIYVGWDPGETRSYEVCVHSLRRSTSPIDIIPITQAALRRSGLYRRTTQPDGTDWIDGKPFSSEFAFTRFLVPALNQYQGWALFCDCDFLFREDVAKLFSLADDRYAVMVVRHAMRKREGTKKQGAVQQNYACKNWSSLVLWNCGHPENLSLSVDDVSTKPGRWLHQFRWLESHLIGGLPKEWNWLEGHSSLSLTPNAVHFTRGAPWMDGYATASYADEWFATEEAIRLAKETVRPGRLYG